MKVKASVKKMCPKCIVVKRGGVVRVVCKADKRHNQRQGFSTLNFNINETVCFCHLNYNNVQILNHHSFTMPKLNKNIAQSKSNEIKEFDNYKL